MRAVHRTLRLLLASDLIVGSSSFNETVHYADKKKNPRSNGWEGIDYSSYTLHSVGSKTIALFIYS